jgi:FKBP-type peptidyl-prolyl cis-trans isomerase
MKIKFLIVSVVVASIAFASCNRGKSVKSAKVKTEADSVSYLLGHLWGSSLKANFPEVDALIIAKGIQDAYEGKDNALITDQMAVDGYIRAYIQKAQEKVGQENLDKGKKFLEENKKKSGIVETESGLQYEVLVQGEGEKPIAESVVKVHYHGTTIDGVVFDSSVDRGQPVEFPLNGVIQGWTEGLQLMNVGSKYRFFIPSELAYGERQASAEIGPNSVLVFEVELLDIIKSEE